MNASSASWFSQPGRAAAVAALLMLAIAGCSQMQAIAVVNRTDEAFYLRYEGQWVWEVPPQTGGIGPTNIENGAKQVEILRADCSRAAAWGIGPSKTITIADATDIESGQSAISEGVSESGQLTPTDQCVLQ